MKKFLIFVLTLLILSSFTFGIGVSAKENHNTTNTVETKIFAVARGGDTRVHPQNSLEAIKACLDLDIDGISATARKTKDGKIILFENQSTKDICIDKSGKRIDKLISETNYKTLSSYNLLSPEGKNLSKKTNSKIALLSDVCELIKDEMILILDVEAAIIDDVYEVVFLNGFSHDVIFRCNDMKTEDLYNWAQKQPAKPDIVASYHGNVITSAISKYKYAVENNICSAEFTTKNQYGVVFSNFFTKRFTSAVRVIASVYNPDLCGQRPDNVTGWEDIISRGASIIETNKAAEISAYKNLLNENLNSLDILYEKLSAKNLEPYKPASVKEFSKELENARQILEFEKTASATEISNCIEELILSADNFEYGSGQNEIFVITPWRILWIIFAVALFASSQIYIFRKTKKSK